MADENRADFQIYSISGASPKKDEPADFIIHGVIGVAQELQDDFFLHGVNQDVNAPADFVIHDPTPQQVGEVDADFTMVRREIPPIRREMPSSKNGIVIGELDVNRVPIFMSADTFSAIQRHLTSLLQSQTPFLELAGAPIGLYCIDSLGRRFVEILAYVPFHTASTGGGVQIPLEEHCRVNNVVNDLRARGVNVNMVVGWVHSHPDMIPAPSDTDIATADRFYDLDYLSTIIFDPVKKVIGVFEPNGQGGLRNKGGLVITGRNRQVVQEVGYCRREHL